MKAHLIFILGIILSPCTVLADTVTDSEKSTARAYRARVMTFIWPAEKTVEQVKYEPLLSLKATPKFSLDESSISDSTQSQGANIEKINNPFDTFQKKLKRGVNVLTNDSWTLIFANQGSKLHHDFHSKPNNLGYAELTGSIQVKLGRYLESNITLNHYLFNAEPQSKATHNVLPDTIISIENSSKLSPETSIEKSDTNNAQDDTSSHQYLPSAQLILNQSNKTASKKLNYLDHPIVGTLIYFEPMDLEEAIQQQALENLMSNIEQISNTNTQ
ncbi:CsiV family protein [Marinomonas sp. 2405UD68-3]|uniref:CsiV family protein n=1 Tax=Marinomonas sp. 2405UD68-3 TaxID=3391835 RepID=UPI0039C906FB